MLVGGDTRACSMAASHGLKGRLPRHCAADPSAVEASISLVVKAFPAIGLPQLDEKAAMLERLDRKYVVQETELRNALAQLVTSFDVLEIDGRRDFTYETCYFDDKHCSSYFAHHQGRRQRFKVRVRKYTDAQLCFVEIKLKGKRGVTVKKRLEYSMDKYGTLDDRARAHLHSAYKALYHSDFNYAIKPVLEMSYQRITLVAKDGLERMTIDGNLAFSTTARSCRIDKNIFIVETKSANGNGIADKVLRSLHQHPTRPCSKYCVAMAALQEVGRYNNFLPALRKLRIGSDHLTSGNANPPVFGNVSKLIGSVWLAIALLSGVTATGYAFTGSV